MGIFISVQKEEEYSGPREEADHIIQKLLRGPVDPVKVFNCQNHGPDPAGSNQQVPDGLEGLFPLLSRFELGVFPILDLKGQKFLERRDDVPKLLVKPKDSLPEFLYDRLFLLAFLYSDERPEYVQ
jgi:hypothetical protein